MLSLYYTIKSIIGSDHFMNKLYNTFDEISSNLANSFLAISDSISKPQAFNLAYTVIGATNSNSIITSSIASQFKGSLSQNMPESNERRIRRFLNNSSFDFYSFYDDLISHVLTNYTVKHQDKNVFVSLDHSYNNDDFTSLTLTLKIGKQSVPIYFRCFEGTDSKEAFSIETIKSALTRAHQLFPDYNIIFLADRWFNNPEIFKIIEELSDYYCIRTKTNLTVSTDGNEFIPLSSIKPYIHKSKILNDVYFTNSTKHKVNIAISPSKDTEDPWYIVTNLDAKRTLKYYSYRFGGIEFFFKAQKSNGYYLEKTTTRNLQVFKNLFGITCVSILWLTIIGVDYSKNKSSVKIKLYDVKRINNKPIRFKSYFKIGKEIFLYAYNSYKYTKLKTNFILYDV